MDSALRRATALLAVLIGLLVAANARAKPPAPLKGSFSLLTYNVAGLPEGLSSSRPSVNMALISKLLNRYDLALVQEDLPTAVSCAAPSRISTPRPPSCASIAALSAMG